MSKYYKCCGCPKFENNEHCDDEIIFCEHELAEHDARVRADAINRFNLLCEIEMNAHEAYKPTRPLSLERLHKVRDKMLEERKKQSNE